MKLVNEKLASVNNLQSKVDAQISEIQELLDQFLLGCRRRHGLNPFASAFFPNVNLEFFVADPCDVVLQGGDINAAGFLDCDLPYVPAQDTLDLTPRTCNDTADSDDFDTGSGVYGIASYGRFCQDLPSSGGGSDPRHISCSILELVPQ